MFRQFARDLKPQYGTLPSGVRDAREIVFLYHPIQLAGLLEAAWAERFQTDARRSPIPALPGGQAQQELSNRGSSLRPGSFLEKLLTLLCIPMPNRLFGSTCHNAVVFDHL